MIITDSHVHIWAADRPGRRWPEGGKEYAHGTDNFTAEQLVDRMHGAGVHRALLLPPSFEGDRNDVCLMAARRYPDRFAVMGRLDLSDPSNVELIPEWIETGGMLGIRLTFLGPSVDWIRDGTAAWFWPAAASAEIPVMLYAPDSLEEIASIAARYPALRLTLDHLGIPVHATDDAVDHFLERVIQLAGLDNLCVKASCLPRHTTDAFPFPFWRDRLARVIEAFGIERVFWGSDLTGLPCTYREAVLHISEHVSFLTAEELRWILGIGVSRWLKWEPYAP